MLLTLIIIAVALATSATGLLAYKLYRANRYIKAVKYTETGDFAQPAVITEHRLLRARLSQDQRFIKTKKSWLRGSRLYYNKGTHDGAFFCVVVSDRVLGGYVVKIIDRMGAPADLEANYFQPLSRHQEQILTERLQNQDDEKDLDSKIASTGLLSKVSDVHI